jgi:hypothetical protein
MYDPDRAASEGPAFSGNMPAVGPENPHGRQERLGMGTPGGSDRERLWKPKKRRA